MALNVRRKPPLLLDPLVWARPVTAAQFAAFPKHMRIEAAALMMEAGLVKGPAPRLERVARQTCEYKRPDIHDENVTAPVPMAIPEKRKHGAKSPQRPGYTVRREWTLAARLLHFFMDAGGDAQASQSDMAEATGAASVEIIRVTMARLVSDGLIERLKAGNRWQKSHYMLTEKGRKNASALFGEGGENA